MFKLNSFMIKPGIFNKKPGFTLVELLIVIVIVGILSTLAVVALGNARAKARDGKRIDDIQQITKALELYYQDNASYPALITPGQSLKSPDGLNTYMSKIPSNPVPRTDNGCGNNDYTYSSTPDNSNYSLNFCLGNAVGSTPAGINSASNAGVGTAPGLIGWWKFDEGSGNAVIDSSGNNKIGTWTNSGTNYIRGKSGSYAGTFSNDSIYVANNDGGYLPSGGSVRTLTFWFKPNFGMTGANLAFSYGCIPTEALGCNSNGLSRYFGAWATTDSIGVHIETCALTGLATPAPTADWHFYTAVFNGDNSVTFYIDGGTPTTITPTGAGCAENTTINTYSGNGFVIGSGRWGSYKGSLDDVRIYNRALSATEILALYNAAK